MVSIMLFLFVGFFCVLLVVGRLTGIGAWKFAVYSSVFLTALVFLALIVGGIATYH